MGFSKNQAKRIVYMPHGNYNRFVTQIQVGNQVKSWEHNLVSSNVGFNYVQKLGHEFMTRCVSRNQSFLKQQILAFDSIFLPVKISVSPQSLRTGQSS